MPAAIGLAIGELLFTIGAPLAVVNFAVFSLGSILVNLALSVGLSLVAGALNRPSSQLPTPSDGQAQIKQPLSPRVRGYGQIRVAGTVWWLDAVTDVLYLGLAINHGRVDSFVNFLIDDNVVDIDGADKVTTSPYSANNVYLHTRLGEASETKYSEILTAFGVDEVRGDGVASMLATIQNPASSATFSNTYHEVPPRVRATIKASVVWDPREAGQDREDATTWQWSENPIVCLLDFMTSADGYGIPYARIEPNLAQWLAAMNVCDELVALAAGGSASRYRLAGQYRLTDDPAAVVDKIMSICDGRVWQRRDGTIGVVAGKFVPPTVTIADKDIVGYSEFMFGQDPASAIAGIRAQYMSPDHGYREHEAEPWPTGSAVLEFEAERTATLDLLFCPSHSQARRLMKRTYARATAAWRGTIVTNLAGLRAIDERFIRLQLTELGIDATGEIVRHQVDPTNPSGPTCEIDVIAVDATIDDWDADTEEGEPEAGTFEYVSSFTKVDTQTLDVLVEAGGTVGQTAFVFAAFTANQNPAAPAGWTRVSVLATAGLHGTMLWKVLDGTETPITFATLGNSSIVCLLFSGMPGPVTSDEDHDFQAGVPGLQIKEAIAAPYVVFQMGAADADISDTSIWYLLDQATKTALSDTQTVVARSAVIPVTVQVNFLVFPFGSTPVDLEAGQTTDQGNNGMASFIASPG